jgi:MscS family membrane protein
MRLDIRRAAALATLALSATAFAQAPDDGTSAGAAAAPAAAPAGADEETAVAPDSPRASLAAYFSLCRSGRYDEAARYLGVDASETARGPELARKLKAVLDRRLWVDLDSVSPVSAGQPGDGLPPRVDQIGALPGPEGREQPVRLVRVEDDNGARWVFSRGTVSRVDAWYGALEGRWVREHLPEVLLRPGPGEVLLWQWIALPFVGLLAWAIGRVLAAIILAVLSHVSARTDTTWDDALVARLRGPVASACALAAAYGLLPWLELTPPAHGLLREVLDAAVVVTVFWAMWRAVDVAGQALAQSPWGRESASARSLLSIGVRAGKVAVAALGVVAGLAQLGYPVASLVAGLGLGGLAFALAAQKTVEHLFGSVSLAVDQPFRVGDFVKVEDFVGTVEEIGLRSTRIRTLDRTLVSIPNGRLADMRLESFTARDRMRLACTIGVEYGTRLAQMREVLEGLERVLREHPKIWPDAVVVRFKEFAASSLDIEVMAWFQTSQWSEFQLIRQEVLLQFMAVVEGAGASFAFPTRTVHVATPAAAPGT